MKLPREPRRVVVTGMGMISPLGCDWGTVRAALLSGKSGIQHMTDWERYSDLNTRVAAPAAPFELDPTVFTRKRTRSMGRIALMAVKTARDALMDAKLLDDTIIQSGRTGVSFGSSAGQPTAVAELAQMVLSDTCRGITATTYVRMMAHTAPVNIGVFFGCRGRIATTSSACTSGSQGIGSAYEAIATGRADVMIAGGCEELHATDAAIFDTLFATSTRWNDDPTHTPRPFDRDRDGLVVGEGSGALILEELGHAQARGAKIYAELVGYGSNSDGAHITSPESEQMAAAMRLALEDADMAPEAVDVINGHGTATDRGDFAESHATYSVFGNTRPYTTYKGNMGHTLGACGALESIFAIHGMLEGFVPPILNLEHPDPECAPLDYVMGETRTLPHSVVMCNNFAFGGINTSLIFKRFQD